MGSRRKTNVEYSIWPPNVSVSVQDLNTSKIKKIIPAAPARVGGGFNIGGSGKAKVTRKIEALNNISDAVVHGVAEGAVTVKGNGELHSGGFLKLDDKIIAVKGKVHGGGQLRGESKLEGDIGIDKKGLVFRVKKKLTGIKEFKAGASATAATDEDALVYVQEFSGTVAIENTVENPNKNQ